MVAEAEIVVAGEVDNPLAVVGADGALLVIQHAEPEEGSALFQIIQLGGEMGKLRARGRTGGHRHNRKPFAGGQYCAAKMHLMNCDAFVQRVWKFQKDGARTMIARKNVLKSAAAGMVFALAILAGCRSKQDEAIDKAKKQAAATGQAQTVVTVDKNGTTTTTVQPPAPGQTTQAVTTTVTPAPASNAAAPVVPADQPAVAGQAAVASEPAASAPAEAPVIRPADVKVAAGTSLAIRINQQISVKRSRAGDRFDGEIVEPVVGDNGSVILPKGTPVGGVVAASHRRGRFKGSSILELRLTSLTLNGTRYPLATSDLTRTKKGKGKRSAAFIGGGTGVGMLIGGVATGGVGLLIGGLAGGGAGTALGAFTGNRDIEIPAESIVKFKLENTLVLQQ